MPPLLPPLTPPPLEIPPPDANPPLRAELDAPLPKPLLAFEAALVLVSPPLLAPLNADACDKVALVVLPTADLLPPMGRDPKRAPVVRPVPPPYRNGE